MEALGYPDQVKGAGLPVRLSNTFISCARVRAGRTFLGCANGVRPGDTVELYSSGMLSTAGMSGSPVFETATGDLLGILKGFGNADLDRRVIDALGVREFNIIRPLVRTFDRLRE